MADTTRRLRLHRPTGGDPAGVPDDLLRLTDQLDATLCGYGQGVLSARPPAGVEGRLYYATDHASLYYDTGETWVVNGHQPGDVRWTGRNGQLDGWLPCDGTTRARAAFPALFSAIGINFGRDVGPTEFRLPDLRGRVPLGAGAGPTLTGRVVGEPGGAETHTLTIAEMPSHSHVNTTGITHGPFIQAGNGYTEAADGDSTQSTGGGRAHNNMPPFLTLGAWIKT